MSDIYEQHRAAFAQVSAFVIARDGERVAAIAFKYPRDGAGRLYAYVHWLGGSMVRGFASGGGYDKHSTACADAARKLAKPQKIRLSIFAAAEGAIWDSFRDALAHDGGSTWDRELERAGFTVWQAV